MYHQVGCCHDLNRICIPIKQVNEIFQNYKGRTKSKVRGKMVPVSTPVVLTLTLFSCLPCLPLPQLPFISFCTVSMLALSINLSRKLKKIIWCWVFIFILTPTDLASLTFLQQADCPTASDLLVNISWWQYAGILSTYLNSSFFMGFSSACQEQKIILVQLDG